MKCANTECPHRAEHPDLHPWAKGHCFDCAWVHWANWTPEEQWVHYQAPESDIPGHLVNAVKHGLVILIIGVILGGSAVLLVEFTT